MQRHRVFIAINLPDNIKQKLFAYQKKIGELFVLPAEEESVGRGPINWTRKENLHITLDFIGYIDNDSILEISEIVKKVASRHSPFLVNLNKICYGPPVPLPAGRAGPIDKKQPKMVWVIGEKSQEFASLRDDIEKSISDFPETRQNSSLNGRQRKFSSHITLGRIKQWEWRRIEPEERPDIDEDINLSFSADSIEIMESILKRKGPEYAILETYNLELET